MWFLDRANRMHTLYAMSTTHQSFLVKGKFGGDQGMMM